MAQRSRTVSLPENTPSVSPEVVSLRPKNGVINLMESRCHLVNEIDHSTSGVFLGVTTACGQYVRGSDAQLVDEFIDGYIVPACRSCSEMRG